MHVGPISTTRRVQWLPYSPPWVYVSPILTKQPPRLVQMSREIVKGQQKRAFFYHRV